MGIFYPSCFKENKEFLLRGAALAAMDVPIAHPVSSIAFTPSCVFLYILFASIIFSFLGLINKYFIIISVNTSRTIGRKPPQHVKTRLVFASTILKYRCFRFLSALKIMNLDMFLVFRVNRLDEGIDIYMCYEWYQLSDNRIRIYFVPPLFLTGMARVTKDG